MQRLDDQIASMAEGDGMPSDGMGVDGGSFEGDMSLGMEFDAAEAAEEAAQ